MNFLHFLFFNQACGVITQSSFMEAREQENTSAQSEQIHQMQEIAFQKVQSEFLDGDHDLDAAFRSLEPFSHEFVNRLFADHSVIEKFRHEMDTFHERATGQISVDAWRAFIQKIDPVNLGIDGYGRTLLYNITDEFHYDTCPKADQAELVRLCLDKMLPNDILIQADLGHGSPFHTLSWCSPLQVTQAFARHPRVTVDHFLVGTTEPEDVFGNNGVVPARSTPLMKSIDRAGDEHYRDLPIAMLLLKCLIDKFCFKLKILRCSCKILSEAFKQGSNVVPENTSHMMFNLSKDMYNVIGQLVATNDAALTISDVLRQSVNAENKNLHQIFESKKENYTKPDMLKEIEDILRNPLSIEAEPFNYYDAFYYGNKALKGAELLFYANNVL